MDRRFREVKFPKLYLLCKINCPSQDQQHTGLGETCREISQSDQEPRLCGQREPHEMYPGGRKGPMEVGERLQHEVEGGVYVLRPQEDVSGHTEGQDQMELRPGDPEQGPGP